MRKLWIPGTDLFVPTRRKLVTGTAAVAAYAGLARGQAVDTLGGSGIAPTACSLAPAAAAAAGYCMNTFSMSAFTPSNVDSTASYASGFGLYLLNWFGFSHTPAVLTFNGDNTVTTGAQASGGGGLTTAAVIPGSPFFVGTAFGGGAYFSCDFLLTAPTAINTSGSNGWPAWWSMSMEHMIAVQTGWPGSGSPPANYNWPGQTNYPYYGEVDFNEYFFTLFGNNQNDYTSSLHGWYSSSNTNDLANQQPNAPAGGVSSFTSYHKYDCLWIPATGSTNGSISQYYDGVLWSTPYSYSQFVGGAGQVPPPTSQPWEMGQIDTQHLSLAITGTSDCQMQVLSLNVWQNSAANNITH